MPGPNASHTRKPTPQGPTRPRVRSAAFARRRIGDAEGSCGGCAGFPKNDKTPSSRTLREMMAAMECWSPLGASRSMCTAFRAASQGLQTISYASPAIAPPVTRVVACTTRGVCFRMERNRWSVDSGVWSTRSCEMVLVSMAHRRVTSNMAKKTAKPAHRT